MEVSVAPILNPPEASLALNGLSATTYPAGSYDVDVRCAQTGGAGSANAANRSVTLTALAT